MPEDFLRFAVNIYGDKNTLVHHNDFAALTSLKRMKAYLAQIDAKYEHNSELASILVSKIQYYIHKESEETYYCCCKLSPVKTHNEHIKPESKYNLLTMDYNNIIASCTQEKSTARFTCGMKKDNEFDEILFISPLEKNCTDHFIFYSNGSIDSDTDRGKYTINLLGLHESKILRESRKSQYDAVYNTCSGMVIDLCQDVLSENGDDYETAKVMYQDFFTEEIIPTYFSDTNGQLPAYIDMLEYFKAQGCFDFDSIVDDLKCLGILIFDAS